MCTFTCPTLFNPLNHRAGTAAFSLLKGKTPLWHLQRSLRSRTEISNIKEGQLQELSATLDIVDQFILHLLCYISLTSVYPKFFKKSHYYLSEYN